jgi:hypothetical protein
MGMTKQYHRAVATLQDHIGCFFQKANFGLLCL